MRPFTAAAVLVATVSAIPGAVSQPQPTAQTPAVDPAAVTAEVRRVIAGRYVLPERRPALDAVLAEGLSSGRYRTSDPGQLAQVINADLERVGHDRHLSFRYAPEQRRPVNPGPADEAAFIAQVKQRNSGVRELRVLPGNVRYMAYDGFDWIGPDSAAALDTAMRFLSGGDAVIIDLRRNGGGSPEAVQYLISHFTDPNRPLMSFFMNGSQTADRTATLAQLPAGRMIGKPLYVLTSRSSASAAEEFVGHVAGYHLGELVGENTAGAGFRNDIVPIAGGFVLSVSVGRAVLAATGRDWEGVGFAPTIAAPVDQALEAAQVHALRRLATTAPASERPRLAAVAAMLEAKVRPVAPALPLGAYAGRYGERVIAIEDGRLIYRRGDRPKMHLIALAPNSFTFEEAPGERLDFAVSGGAVSGFEVVRVNGPSETQARTGAN